MAQQDDTVTFTIDGKDYPFDDFTLGELEELEEYAGDSFARLDYTRAAVMLFVAFLVLRRDDKSLTIEKVRERPLSLLAVKEEEPEARPTPSRAKKAEVTA